MGENRMSRRTAAASGRLSILIAGALLLAAPLAHADWVASAEEERAYLAKMRKGAPPAVAQVVKPFPGATFDAQCSLNAWGGDADAYAFRTKASRAEVEQHFKEHAPDATVGALAIYGEWCDGGGTTDYVVRVWPPQKAAKLKAAAEARTATIAKLAANPPAADSLGLPLPPNAVYDAECSYDSDRQRLDRYPGRYDSVACYGVTTDNRDSTVQMLREMGLRPGSFDNNVQVDIPTQQAPMKVAYWVGKGGPTKSLAEWRAANAPAKPAATASAGTTQASGTSGGAPAPADTSQPSAPNAVEKAKDAAKKLKGLFGR